MTNPRIEWLNAVVFAGVCSFVLTFAVLPRECGVPGNEWDMYFISHPGVASSIGVAIALGLLWALSRTEGSGVPPLTVRRLAALAAISGVAFATSRELRATGFWRAVLLNELLVWWSVLFVALLFVTRWRRSSDTATPSTLR